MRENLASCLIWDFAVSCVVENFASCEDRDEIIGIHQWKAQKGGRMLIRHVVFPSVHHVLLLVLTSIPWKMHVLRSLSAPACGMVAGLSVDD